MSILKNRYVQIFFAGVVAVFGFAYFTGETAEETTASITEEANVETTPVSATTPNQTEATNPVDQTAENTEAATASENTETENTENASETEATE